MVNRRRTRIDDWLERIARTNMTTIFARTCSTPARRLKLLASRCVALGAAIAALIASPMVLAAQSSEVHVGTLLVAHGGSAQWNAGVDSLAATVRTGGPVAVSFLMGPAAATHRFQDAVADLVARGAKQVVVVPVLVSSHSGHMQQIRYLAGETDSLGAEMMHHLHMSGITRPTVRVPIRVAGALDNSPQLARVMADHALKLATDPQKQALFLIGHGPNDAEDYALWMINLRQVEDSVRKWTGFADVKVGLVRDDAPPEVRAEAVREIRETIRMQHQVTSRPVVVVPILISSGEINHAKLPADLHDLPIVYNAVPVLPNAAIAEWVEARVSGMKDNPPDADASSTGARPLQR
jgi:sirohydrochlorin ferrochelatase